MNSIRNNNTTNYKGKCSRNDLQYFQVHVNVQKAKGLKWNKVKQPISFVTITIGNKTYTSELQHNFEPIFGQSFVFDINAGVTEIKRSIVEISVKSSLSSNVMILGETEIYLGTVWDKPNHETCDKWFPLSLHNKAAGHIKLDISIVFSNQVIPVSKIDDYVHVNDGLDYQRALYQVVIYKAFNLPNSIQLQGHRNGKPPTTFVRVYFEGLTAKTAQQRGINPEYQQQISLVQMFPSSTKNIKFEVVTAESPSQVLASTRLEFSRISHGGINGFLPTFGPSLLHMYSGFRGNFVTSSEEDPFNRGSLLISLRTVVPFHLNGVGHVNQEPASPIHMEHLWDVENFCIICPLLEVSMLDISVTKKICGVAVTTGEIFNEKPSITDQRKLNYTGVMDVFSQTDSYGHLEFPDSFPALRLSIQLPDFRVRVYRNNMMQWIYDSLESVTSGVKCRFFDQGYTSLTDLLYELSIGLDQTGKNIVKYLEHLKFAGTNQKFKTQLDENVTTLQIEELEKLLHHINLITDNSKVYGSDNVCKDNVRNLLTQAKYVLTALECVQFKNYEGWPDIIIWILRCGSRVAYCKMRASDVIHSALPEQRGKRCGQIQTLFMKPLQCKKHPIDQCSCFCGKIELMLWMGLLNECCDFDSYLPEGYHLLEKVNSGLSISCSSMTIECHAYICRLKLKCSIDIHNTTDIFVRINVLNAAKETKVISSSSSVWNEVLKIEKKIPMTLQRLISSPPTAVVELCMNSAGKNSVIGSQQIQPVAAPSQNEFLVPDFQWFDLYQGFECIGQILLHLCIFPSSQANSLHKMYNNVEEKIFYVSSYNDRNLYEVMHLPEIVAPKANIYKLDVNCWGLRDLNETNKPCVMIEMDEARIKSDVIMKKNPNCNFRNARKSLTIRTSLDDITSPKLHIRVFDSSSFGRVAPLCRISKNPNKYLVDWFTKEQRDKAVRVPIDAPDFYQENKNLYIKKTNLRDSFSIVSEMPKKSTICFKKKLSEEEMFLLPTCHGDFISYCWNETNNTKPSSQWWMRYCSSLKDSVIDDGVLYGHKIKVYDNELELQKEFSKFKDWCASIKLYNNKNESNVQKYIGQLKVGIAIYSLPPTDASAVNFQGVDLKPGNFFDEYPISDSSKYLVRVYIIKGIDLETYDWTGTCNLFISVSCGDITLENRNECVTKSRNPIFCKLYEFRCSLPENYLMHVSVINKSDDRCDEIIGSTAIDLENRIYSKHRALVGLPSKYLLSGPSKWRDCVKPSTILETLCSKNHIAAPKYLSSSSVSLNGVEYKYSDSERLKISERQCKENICLCLLNSWHTLPICGYHLVPEHVETRNLFCENNPGQSQGKIQMWVDIFPLDGRLIPPPVDITPVEPVDYHFVITVKNINVSTSLVKKNTAEIRLYFGDLDVTFPAFRHRIIKNKLNWSVVFHIRYQYADSKVLIEDVENSGFEEPEYYTPILLIQVVNPDVGVDANVIIGELMFNLMKIPPGTKSSAQRSLHKMTKEINLFTRKSLTDWWSLLPAQSSDQKCGVGNINLELKLLTTDEIKSIPASCQTVYFTFDEARHNTCPFLRLKSHISETQIIILLTAIVFILICVIGYNNSFTKLWISLKRNWNIM